MNAPERFPSVRQRLRLATEEVHQALHRAAPFAAIADGRATRDSYANTLLLLHRFHAGQSAFCLRAASLLGLPQLGAAHGARITALKTDMAWLGARIESDTVPDRAMSDDACIGALYTVQGSTLGGKVIYRQLDSLLTDDAGRCFFKGTPDDGRQWQALCAALETCGGDAAGMEQGALQAFRDFRDLLG